MDIFAQPSQQQNYQLPQPNTFLQQAEIYGYTLQQQQQKEQIYDFKFIREEQEEEEDIFKKSHNYISEEYFSNSNCQNEDIFTQYSPNTSYNCEFMDNSQTQNFYQTQYQKRPIKSNEQELKININNEIAPKQKLKLNQIKIQFPKKQSYFIENKYFEEIKQEEQDEYCQLDCQDSNQQSDVNNNKIILNKKIKKQPKQHKKNYKNQKVNLGKKFITNQYNELDLGIFQSFIMKNTDLQNLSPQKLQDLYFQYLQNNYSNYNGQQFQQFFQDYSSLTEMPSSKFQQIMKTKMINNKNFKIKRKFEQSKTVLLSQLNISDLQSDFIKKNKVQFAKQWDLYKNYNEILSKFNQFNRLCLYRYLTNIFPTQIFTVPKLRTGYKMKDRESVNEFSLYITNQKLFDTELFTNSA